VILADQEVDRRDFGRGRQPVLDEADRLRLARVVVAELLEQRAADTLRHAAPQLALDQHRIDGPADLVGDQVAQHPDLSGARVYRDDRGVRAVRVGHVRDLETAARGQAGRLARFQVRAGRSGRLRDLGQGQRGARIAADG
jgi:hypothetical protein